MSDVEPQGSSNPHNPSTGSDGTAFGCVLIGIGIVLVIACLPMAFEDPSTSCAAGHDCIAILDMRPIGWTGVVIGLVAGVLGAWMVYSGSRRPPKELE